MAKREPQQNENPKTTLFVTGQKTSQILKLAVADLSTLKRPFCERFTKKNDIHPFDDASCTSSATAPHHPMPYWTERTNTRQLSSSSLSRTTPPS
jgi:hypothetical protein